MAETSKVDIQVHKMVVGYIPEQIYPYIIALTNYIRKRITDDSDLLKKHIESNLDKDICELNTNVFMPIPFSDLKYDVELDKYITEIPLSPSGRVKAILRRYNDEIKNDVLTLTIANIWSILDGSIVIDVYDVEIVKDKETLIKGKLITYLVNMDYPCGMYTVRKVLEKMDYTVYYGILFVTGNKPFIPTPINIFD